MIEVLSTRTLKEHLINYGRALNLSIDCIDFIEIIPAVADPLYRAPDSIDSILFTSANAVKYFFENYPADKIMDNKTIFSLTAKTSEELMLHGIEADYTADTATTLSRVLLDTKKAKSVLHICGDKRLNIIEEKLSQSGIQYHQLIVYKTILQVDKKITHDFDAIMFYSPSGIQAFVTSNILEKEQIFCCIGDTTANALREINSGLNILIPDKISLESMIDKIAQYYKNHSPAK